MIKTNEPLTELSKEFYAEKPIKLIALGTYQELATFVSDISGLPRIVTIHNINLQAADEETDADDSTVTSGDAVARRLRMEALIKTYRYLEDSDLEDDILAKK